MRSDDSRAAPWPKLDPASRSAEVRAFFDRRAPVYDPVADRPYWAFSDKVLLALLRRTLLSGLGEGEGLRLLDAGGGTGRWALRLLRELPRATALLADVSPGMLEVARRKAARSGAGDRLSLLELDLNAPLPRRLGPFDIVLCFHNVAGLVADPAALIRRLVHVTAPGGLVALVLPNLWQAASKSLRDGRPGELNRLATRSAVRYGDDVPEVLVFSPSVARRCLEKAGCFDVTVRGFPVSVHPEGPGEDLPAFLDDVRLLRRLVPPEANLCLPTEAAARGNSLLAIGRRPER
ncbi:MAG TPA: class I SAM-dependent methyltransferase [Thermoanaerobaculia bacterium]|nr:class I SAM-dependent methyltransferase [Thermoanaerobaculia bacterium]